MNSTQDDVTCWQIRFSCYGDIKPVLVQRNNVDNKCETAYPVVVSEFTGDQRYAAQIFNSFIDYEQK